MAIGLCIVYIAKQDLSLFCMRASCPFLTGRYSLRKGTKCRDTASSTYLRVTNSLVRPHPVVPVHIGTLPVAGMHKSAGSRGTEIW